MSHMMQPSIILLKEGTDTSQGTGQLISNINACTAIVDIIKTTLGPRGMDKLVYEGKKVTVSNDGATIMKLLDIVHPAAKSLVDISLSQDSEVGDGTTSVVLVAGELLKKAKPFVEEGVHPRIIIKGFRAAAEIASKKLSDLAVSIKSDDDQERRKFLQRCAETSLNSKLIASHKEFFGKMVVDAVSLLEDDLDTNMIGICKEAGASLEDSMFVEGVAFKKTFSYAGFEMQPKSIKTPKILALNLELELKSEKDNAEIRISSPEEYQKIVEAEWKIIYQKLESIAKCGAAIILSRLPIGDLATQYFADRDIFCAGRVPDEDLKRVCKATGAITQTTVSNLIPEILGSCSLFEEKQIGGSRYNVFTGCTRARSCTIVLRGAGEQFIAEAERSLHDSIMIARRATKNQSVVGGGGSIEMELSEHLGKHAMKIPGKQQLIIGAYAKALECIPRQLTANAGFDPITVLNLLREKHSSGGTWFGVDIDNEGQVLDCFENMIWEPSLVKGNILKASTEAACLILSIDETVKSESSEDMSGAPPGYGRGRGRGM